MIKDDLLASSSKLTTENLLKNQKFSQRIDSSGEFRSKIRWVFDMDRLNNDDNSFPKS